MIAETLVERLKGYSPLGASHPHYFGNLVENLNEAADAIERLTAERDSAYESLRRLQAGLVEAQLERDALKELVERYAGNDCWQYDKYLNPVACGQCDSCCARAVLAAWGTTP